MKNSKTFLKLLPGLSENADELPIEKFWKMSQEIIKDNICLLSYSTCYWYSYGTVCFLCGNLDGGRVNCAGFQNRHNKEFLSCFITFQGYKLANLSSNWQYRKSYFTPCFFCDSITFMILYSPTMEKSKTNYTESSTILSSLII